MISRYLRTALYAVVLSMAAGVAQSDQPVAVILDVNGPIFPDVEPFDEVEAGTSLKLATGTQLVIGHYRTCDEVTLTGGEVAIADDHFIIEGTDEVSSEQGACVGDVQLETADLVSASIVTRSLTAVSKIAPRSSVGIAGRDAAKYTEMSIRRGGNTLLTAPIARQRAMIYDTVGALKPGARVVVVLTGPDVQTRAAWVEISAQAPAWTILRH